jgi:hypothetical protein
MFKTFERGRLVATNDAPVSPMKERPFEGRVAARDQNWPLGPVYRFGIPRREL